MARFVQFLLLIELILIIPCLQSARHGFDAEFLHADNELPSKNIIEPEELSAFVRSRRDVKTSSSEAATSTTASATKKPTVPQTITNIRENMTMQTVNNITTMVGLIYICFISTFHKGIINSIDNATQMNKNKLNLRHD